MDADDRSDCCSVTEAGTVGSPSPDLAMNRPGLLSLFLLSAWCGLVAGLLEVGTIVLRKQVVDPDRLYKMSRHFVWMIPLSNVCVFVTLGAAWVWHRAGLATPRSLAVQALLVRACALTLHPGCFSPDLQPGLAARGTRAGRAAGPAHRAQ